MKPQTNYTEHELLEAIASGSRDAFEVIYKQNYVLIYHFAKRFVNDSQLAEDITTESFIKLWERFSQFNSLQGIKSFLFTSAKNACLNQARSDARAQMRESEFAYLSGITVDELSSNEDVIGRVYQYIYNEIEKLPAQEKRVFKMAFIEGLTNEAIAQELGINNQSVRNHKARALKTLRLAVLSKSVYAYYLLLLWLAGKA